MRCRLCESGTLACISPDDLTLQYIECGERGPGAVTLVVVRHRLGFAAPFGRGAHLAELSAWVGQFVSAESSSRRRRRQNSGNPTSTHGRERLPRGDRTPI